MKQKDKNLRASLKREAVKAGRKTGRGLEQTKKESPVQEGVNFDYFLKKIYFSFT